MSKIMTYLSKILLFDTKITIFVTKLCFFDVKNMPFLCQKYVIFIIKYYHISQKLSPEQRVIVF